MNSAFVRGLWGDLKIRDGKLMKDILLIQNNPYTSPFVTYVFGDNNYKLMKEMGFECRVIQSEHTRYPYEQLYRHKLDILLEAMKDYDEITFLDWDVRPCRPLPEYYWEVSRKKAPFQANLFQYRTKKCLWRTVDWRKVCNGGWIFLKDKSFPQKIIDKYDELRAWTLKKKAEREAKGKALRFREEAQMFDDEPALCKFVDDYMGGWKGEEYYFNNFEPDFCNLGKKSVYSEYVLSYKKNVSFVHWGK